MLKIPTTEALSLLSLRRTLARKKRIYTIISSTVSLIERNFQALVS
nr:MAG TPA: hypothetical protein [Caudoviricetes sp.]